MRPVQCGAATMANMAPAAIESLYVSESKGIPRVRIPLSPPINISNILGHKSLHLYIRCLSHFISHHFGSCIRSQAELRRIGFSERHQTRGFERPHELAVAGRGI